MTRCICVLRSVDGKNVVLRLHDQQWYKEWTGCFTYLGVWNYHTDNYL